LLLEFKSLVVVRFLYVVEHFNTLPHVGDSAGIKFVEAECLALIVDAGDQVFFVHQRLLSFLKSRNLLDLIVHHEEL